jgi:hypothetical protein
LNLTSFWRSCGSSTLILAALAGLGIVGASWYRYHPTTDTTVKKALRTLHKRDLNREGRDQAVAGYYEGLLDSAATQTKMRGQFSLDPRRWLAHSGAEKTTDNPAQRGRRERDDFLRYDLMPNLDVAEYADPRIRLVTNSEGLADREYSHAKPAGTRRMALIGDSLARGMGAPPEADFESLLEAKLDAWSTSQHGPRVEIVNFGVQGYNVTQFVDVVLERVPEYHPDVCLLVLSERAVFRRWTDHLASLVHDGMDLKYDFLRDLVRRAGVTPGMSEAVVNARLARYRLQTLSWALETMSQQARSTGTEFVVVLVPSADDPEVIIDQFGGARRLIRELGLKSVDVLDTFAYLPNLEGVRVNYADRHPNEAGHRMLFERLAGAFMQDPSLRTLVLGADAGSAVRNASITVGRAEKPSQDP